MQRKQYIKPIAGEKPLFMKYLLMASAETEGGDLDEDPEYSGGIGNFEGEGARFRGQMNVEWDF